MKAQENKNIAELTFEQIVSLLQERGATIETSTNRFGDPMLGIKSRHSYHWISKCKLTGSIHFEQTYSTNTGRTKAGVMYRVRTSMSIQSKYGVQWN